MSHGGAIEPDRAENKQAERRQSYSSKYAALRNFGDKLFQQGVGQIDGASKLCYLFVLPIQLLVNRGAALQLLVQSLAHVIELIFNHGEDIGS